MDHAEARERMQAAVAAPGGLATLVADASPEAVAVRAHVRDCAACTGEWRAWSVMSLGLASAAPDDLRLRPEARDATLGAVLARPRPAAAPVAQASSGPLARPVTAPMADARPTDAPASVAPPTRPSGITSGRVVRAPAAAAGTSRTQRRTTEPAAARPWFRWLALSAAAAVLLFVIGAAFGRQLTGPGPTPTGPTTADLSRFIAITADVLQKPGSSVAQLQTPDGSPGGFVAVSTSGDLVVASRVLELPPEGARYVCVLERAGSSTPVGYMHFDGDVAYWAGPVTEPNNIGLSGDVFIVQLDTDGAQPALTGTF